MVRNWLTQYHPDVLNSMGGSSHEKLQFCMEQLAIDHLNKKFSMVAMKLKVLHRIRVHADYYIEDEFTDGQVKTLIKEKERICELLAELTT